MASTVNKLKAAKGNESRLAYCLIAIMSITTWHLTSFRTYSCRSLRLENLDRGVFYCHCLARANLARLAQLDLAVDLHFALGDARFRRAAAIGEAHQLEQVVQFDVVACEREFEARHVVSLRKVGAERAPMINQPGTQRASTARTPGYRCARCLQ